MTTQDKCGPLTIEEIYALIDRDNYRYFDDTPVTVCCLTMKNGAHVVGESLHIDYANRDMDARKAAFDNAVSKIWELEYYKRYGEKSCQ